MFGYTILSGMFGIVEKGERQEEEKNKKCNY